MLTAKAATKPNGANEAPLPEHHLKVIEAGLASAERLKLERDDLEQRLHDANLKIEAMTVQLESVKSVVNMMESSFMSTKAQAEDAVRQYREERDAAVASTARLGAVLDSLYAVLNTREEPDDRTGKPDADAGADEGRNI